MAKNHATKRRFYKNALAIYTSVQNFIRAFCSVIRYNSLCWFRVSDVNNPLPLLKDANIPLHFLRRKFRGNSCSIEAKHDRSEKKNRRGVALRCTSRTRNANCLVKRATRDKESITNEPSTASRATMKKVAVASENRAKVLYRAAIK